MKSFFLLLVGAAGLTSCALTTAPVGTERAKDLCGIVRQQVRAGEYPLYLAERWYPECAPYTVDSVKK